MTSFDRLSGGVCQFPPDSEEQSVADSPYENTDCSASSPSRIERKMRTTSAESGSGNAMLLQLKERPSHTGTTQVQNSSRGGDEERKTRARKKAVTNLHEPPELPSIDLAGSGGGGRRSDRRRTAGGSWERPDPAALRLQPLTKEDEAFLATRKAAAYRMERRALEEIASRLDLDRYPPGDLRPNEVKKIQKYVDANASGWACGLAVVGSAARGERRGLDTPRAPIHKDEGGRSDIDYTVPEKYWQDLVIDDEMQDRWLGKLPDIETDPDLLPGPFMGAPEFGNQPAIVFFKDRSKPLYLPAGLLPETHA
ncbi:hypothetical protein LJR230_002168 [Trinickia sp. LjRoot230]|uniref:hypothetical protein n=1 Tax=Trinickia sp. LjRoot230 TaxID=3342288 RepID=UPI003ECD1D8E